MTGFSSPSRALITGASAGLGEVFARTLAAQLCDLVLVARDEQRLERLAEALRHRHNITVEVLPADLTNDADVARVEARLRDAEAPIDLLVNNAGSRSPAPFVPSAIDEQRQSLALLVETPMRLAHAVLPGMIERRRGGLLNVASVAGFVPRGTYGANKAWLIAFSEALAKELQGTGVTVCALCPGFTHTEFHQRAGVDKARIPKPLWLDAQRVVNEGMADLAAGKVISVPSKRYTALVAASRLVPRGLVTRLSGVGSSTGGRDGSQGASQGGFMGGSQGGFQGGSR
ncbi:MAG: SDR family NAD(P)-dependent oxidoreductase [Actinomycetales bacterium]